MKHYFKNGIWFFLLLTIGSYFFTLQFLSIKLEYIPGNFGDARLNMFFLEHGFQFLSGKINSYWDAPFMYPDIKTLSYSDNLLGTLPIYAVFRALSFDRETSFQSWFIMIVFINYISSFLCFKKIGFDTILSSIGAYIFAFGIIVISRIGHIQLLATFCIPWVFYFSYLHFLRENLKWIAISWMFLVWQFYCGMYLGFLTGFIYFIFQSALIVKKPKLLFDAYRANHFQIFKLALYFLVPIVSIVPLLIPYLQRSLMSGYKSYNDVKPLLLSFRNFLMPTEGSFSWSYLEFFNRDVPLYWEKQLWVGGLLFLGFFYYLVLRIFGRFKGSGMHFILFLSITISCLVMINWGNGFSFFQLIREFPGLSAIKPVGRIIVPLMFLIIWHFLLLIKNIKPNQKIKPVFYVILIFLVVMDNLVKPQAIKNKSYSKEESQMRINSLVYKASEAINQNSNQKYKAIAFLSSEERNPVELQIESALAGQQLHIPTINGYSSTCHGEFGVFWENHDSISLIKWLHYHQLEIEKDGILIINSD